MDEAIHLTKREAEQVVRFVTENHDRIGRGVDIARLSNGRLRVQRSDAPGTRTTNRTTLYLKEG